jgi:hypothetical protein
MHCNAAPTSASDLRQAADPARCRHRLREQHVSAVTTVGCLHQHDFGGGGGLVRDRADPAVHLDRQLLDIITVGCPMQGRLNEFMAAGRPTWRSARSALQRLLSGAEGELRDHPERLRRVLFAQVRMRVRSCVTGRNAHWSACGSVARGVGARQRRGAGGGVRPVGWVPGYELAISQGKYQIVVQGVGLSTLPSPSGRTPRSGGNLFE